MHVLEAEVEMLARYHQGQLLRDGQRCQRTKTGAARWWAEQRTAEFNIRSWIAASAAAIQRRINPEFKRPLKTLFADHDYELGLLDDCVSGSQAKQGGEST